MKTAHDYESLAHVSFTNRKPILSETYTGTSIVQWHGKIEGQLENMLADAEKGRNFPYADKLREFLRIWRANEITGSINRETLDALKSASEILAVDNWDLKTYFRSLRDNLRVLVASEEQLPRDVDMSQNDPMAGGGAGGPPMSPAFGPQEKPPGGGPPGGEGGEVPPGGEEGAPGAEQGAPTPEEGAPAPPGAEDMPDKNKFGEL